MAATNPTHTATNRTNVGKPSYDDRKTWLAELRGKTPSLDASTVATLPVDAQPYEIRDKGKHRIPGLFIRIEPTGRKSWYCDYHSPVTGKLVRLRIGDSALSLKRARTEATNIRAQVSKGRCPKLEREKEIAAERERLRAEKAATRRHNEALLGRFVDDRYHRLITDLKTHGAIMKRLRVAFPHWWDVPMPDIDRKMVEDWRRDQLERGLSAETVNKDVTMLQGVMTRAAKDGVIDHSPLAGLGSLKVVRDDEPVWLEPDELKRLHDALRARDAKKRAERDRYIQWQGERGVKPLKPFGDRFVDHLEPIIILALGTGMRKGEILGLEWRDVDFKGGQIHIRASGTKSAKPRSVPLTPKVRQALKDWQGPAVPMRHLLVFPGRGGQRMKDIKTAWFRVRKDAGLEYSKIAGRRWRFHDFRHDYCSRLAQHGVSLFKVQTLAGHSSPLMTMRYAKLMPNELSDEVCAALADQA